jgi:hypothetical protein
VTKQHHYNGWSRAELQIVEKIMFTFFTTEVLPEQFLLEKRELGVVHLSAILPVKISVEESLLTSKVLLQLTVIHPPIEQYYYFQEQVLCRYNYRKVQKWPSILIMIILILLHVLSSPVW